MNEKNNFDINFAALFDSIVRRLWLILLCAVVLAGAAYGYVRFFVDPVYSSTATLYIGNDTGSINYTDVNLYETLAKDFEVIIKKRAVLEEVADRLDLKIGVSSLRNALTVKNISNTRILDITVSTNDPVLSKNVADMLCSVASEKFVSIVKVDYVSIVDTGSLSSSPTNINLARSMVLAAFAGALICTFIIMVRTLMDDKIRTPDDVEFYLGLSVLGTTPFSKNLEADSSGARSSLKRRIFKKSNRHRK